MEKYMQAECIGGNTFKGCGAVIKMQNFRQSFNYKGLHYKVTHP